MDKELKRSVMMYYEQTFFWGPPGTHPRTPGGPQTLTLRTTVLTRCRHKTVQVGGRGAVRTRFSVNLWSLLAAGGADTNHHTLTSCYEFALQIITDGALGSDPFAHKLR